MKVEVRECRHGYAMGDCHLVHCPGYWRRFIVPPLDKWAVRAPRPEGGGDA